MAWWRWALDNRLHSRHSVNRNGPFISYWDELGANRRAYLNVSCVDSHDVGHQPHIRSAVRSNERNNLTDPVRKFRMQRPPYHSISEDAPVEPGV